MWEIDENYRVPAEHVQCPGCGRKYGHHQTKVCMGCEECSTCCRCKEKGNHKPAGEAVPLLLTRD